MIPSPANPTDWAKVAANLSKPMTKLIEVVAEGVGGAYAPLGTVLQAQADSKAQLILAQGNIEKRELLLRAGQRIAHIESERQRNIEAVVEEAKKSLPESVSDSPVDKGWLNSFFTSVQDVADADLQKLWAKILAGEVAQPRQYSLRFLEFLKTFSKEEAEWFRQYLGFCLLDDRGWPFFVDTAFAKNKLKAEVGSVDVRRHFHDIGLTAESTYPALSRYTFPFSYGEKKYRFKGPPPPSGSTIEMFVVVVGVTAIGVQLARLALPGVRFDPEYIAGLNSAMHRDHGISIEERKE